MARALRAGLQSGSSYGPRVQQYDRASFSYVWRLTASGPGPSGRWCCYRGCYRLLHQSSSSEGIGQRLCLGSCELEQLKTLTAELFLSLTSLFNGHLLTRALSTSPETLLTTMALYYYPLPIRDSEERPTTPASDKSREQVGHDPSSSGNGASATCGEMDRVEGRDC